MTDGPNVLNKTTDRTFDGNFIDFRVCVRMTNGIFMIAYSDCFYKKKKFMDAGSLFSF